MLAQVDFDLSTRPCALRPRVSAEVLAAVQQMATWSKGPLRRVWVGAVPAAPATPATPAVRARAPEWMTKALRQPHQFGRATPAPLSESRLASPDLNELLLSRSVVRLRRTP